MGQRKDRLFKLIDQLFDDPETRDVYKKRAANVLTDAEAEDVANDIEAILRGTPDGEVMIKAYVAKQMAAHRKRKPRS